MNNKSEYNLIHTVSDVPFGYINPSPEDDPSAPSPPNPRGIASLLGGPAEGGMRLKPKRARP
jgi:hypothetical protein